MPMINVQMFEGRTAEQRRKLAKELTDATCKALGCTPDAVQIIPNSRRPHDRVIGADLA